MDYCFFSKYENGYYRRRTGKSKLPDAIKRRVSFTLEVCPVSAQCLAYLAIMRYTEYGWKKLSMVPLYSNTNDGIFVQSVTSFRAWGNNPLASQTQNIAHPFIYLRPS
jgi:hypothetical protein